VGRGRHSWRQAIQQQGMSRAHTTGRACSGAQGVSQRNVWGRRSRQAKPLSAAAAAAAACLQALHKTASGRQPILALTRGSATTSDARARDQPGASHAGGAGSSRVAVEAAGGARRAVRRRQGRTGKRHSIGDRSRLSGAPQGCVWEGFCVKFAVVSVKRQLTNKNAEPHKNAEQHILRVDMQIAGFVLTRGCAGCPIKLLGRVLAHCRVKGGRARLKAVSPSLQSRRGNPPSRSAHRRTSGRCSGRRFAAGDTPGMPRCQRATNCPWGKCRPSAACC
jgi:hypothetical protein